MANFLFVHGAMCSDAFFEPTAAELRRRGHTAHVPLLTGCGGRTHLLTRELGLETHVKDVVATAEYLDLRDFLLVGHSYGGSVITAAAERLSERLAGMVYVDAVFPEDGENTWDKVKAFEEPFGKIAVEIGDGYKMSITEDLWPLYGIKKDESLQWLKKHCTEFPFKALSDKLSLPNKVAENQRGLFIWGADSPASEHFVPCRDQAKKSGYQVAELPYGHWVNIEAPVEVAELIHGFVT